MTSNAGRLVAMLERTGVARLFCARRELPGCARCPARQDSTPLLLCIGQVESAMLGRGAFQEVDYRHFHGGMAKAVLDARSGDDLAELADGPALVHVLVDPDAIAPGTSLAQLEAGET